MNIDQSQPKSATEFLNFSDALHHLRWGERIARRTWNNGRYVEAKYDGTTALRVKDRDGSHIAGYLFGTDLMAEDWYVL